MLSKFCRYNATKLILWLPGYHQILYQVKTGYLFWIISYSHKLYCKHRFHPPKLCSGWSQMHLWFCSGSSDFSLCTVPSFTSDFYSGVHFTRDFSCTSYKDTGLKTLGILDWIFSTGWFHSWYTHFHWWCWPGCIDHDYGVMAQNNFTNPRTNTPVKMDWRNISTGD